MEKWSDCSFRGPTDVVSVNMALRHYNGTYQTILIDSGLQWEIMGRSGCLATALIHRDAAGSARSPGPRIKLGGPCTR